MKRVLRTAAAALLIAVLCIAPLATTVRADTASGSTSNMVANLDVTINSTVVPEPGDTVTLVLTAANGGPLPEGAADGVYKQEVEIREAVTQVQIPITFTSLGVYEYTLHLEGSDKYTDERFAYFAEYDTDVYEFTFSVINNFDDKGVWQGLVVTSNIYVEGFDDTEGKPTLVFDNTYDPPVFVSVLKKWVGGVGDSVQVSLMSGDEKYDTLTLSKAGNNWTYTWDGSEFGGPGHGLNGKHAWYVEEVKNVPGFASSTKYDQNKEIWIITNTRSLIQTGQLNWPVPVLTVVGMMFIALGYGMLRRREEQDA